MTNHSDDTENKEKTLGHGDHWAALGVQMDDTLIRTITLPITHGNVAGKFSAPWPNAPCEDIIQYELPQDSLILVALEGLFPETNTLKFLSAFPVLIKTNEWIVQVSRPSDHYGAFEGIVQGKAASGHSLCWFAPRFGFEVDHWRTSGLARVAFAALALRVKHFKAKPIIIRDGLLVDQHREELRAQGRHEEADAPDLEVTIFTKGMRTFYSSFHDHHEFIGKVLRIRPIQPRPEFHGWLIDLECLNDEPETGWMMPLYVFPASLHDGSVPKRGDLVQGLAWLQGTWTAPASEEDAAAWKQSEVIL